MRYYIRYATVDRWLEQAINIPDRFTDESFKDFSNRVSKSIQDYLVSITPTGVYISDTRSNCKHCLADTSHNSPKNSKKIIISDE